MGPKAEADVLQIIQEVRQRYKVGRTFVLGASMGGAGALTFTVLHPDLVAGVCSLNGAANFFQSGKFDSAIQASFGGTRIEVPDEYRKRSAGFWPERFTMPVAIVTGGKDDTVPPQSVIQLAATLMQGGRKVLNLYREAQGHATNYADTCTAMEFVLREARPFKQ